MPFPDDVPVLGDGVVTLRAHRPDDAPRIIEQCTDPASVRWTSVPQPYGAAEARDFLEGRVARCWDEGESWIYAIEHDGVFVGTIDLRPHGVGESEVGFGLHPDARGRGLVRRALGLLVDWAFAECDVAVVHWRCDEGNWASRRAAWAVGFHFGATIPARRGRPDRWTGWLGRGDPRTPTTPWLVPVLLEEDGVRLRPWRASDGDRLVEAALDPVLQAGIPQSPLPRSPGAVPSYLLRGELAAATGARVAWCVADAETDVALGNVALFGLGAHQAEVGYWAHPEGRGTGVMRTALRLLVDHAVGTHGVARLYLLTAAGNTGSRRLAERAGFVHVGTERASSPTADGGWDDTAVYDLLG